MKIGIVDFVPPIGLKLLRALRNLVHTCTSNVQFNASADDYDADKYWTLHHKKHGVDSLIGVGHGGLDEDTNRAWYAAAKYVFFGTLNDLGIKRPGKVLELGYGTGFYSRIMYELGAGEYLGIDIVDHHVSNMKAEMSEYRFEKHDVGVDAIDFKECDLIYMVDVSQHIVNDEKMEHCLKVNVLNNLAENGVFIVTDELENRKYDFHEKSRTIEFYQEALGLQLVMKPVQFRDKYLFAFKK